MARPAQRYIEPTEIYQDLQRGSGTQIPRDFPYTWNPVNGLGSVESRQVGDFFSDLINSVTGAAGGAASDEANEFLRSGPGKEFFLKVEDSAAVGVTEVVKQQAPNLILLAVAGGAVGGALFSKLGKTGTVLAIGVAGLAAFRILNAVAPPKKAK